MYVLESVTRGDELFHSERTPVAASANRLALEELGRWRTAERDAYARSHPDVMALLGGSAIVRDEIREVEQI